MKKSFGQNLLIDKNYLNKIIKVTNLSKNDTAIEIGAGSGLLTVELAKKVKKVYAIELEREILAKLKNNLKANNLDNVEIIEKSFLSLDLSTITSSSSSPLTVIGNIPYNITSKILLKLFGEIDKPSPYLNNINKIYLMLQYEVAKRITAKPNTKDYSPLTLLVQFFSCPEILFEVPANTFYPKPKVNSAFVIFNIKKKLAEISNPFLLKKIIRTAFQQRRKKIINTLSVITDDKKQLSNILKISNINENLRPENLTLEDYIKITNLI